MFILSFVTMWVPLLLLSLLPQTPASEAASQRVKDPPSSILPPTAVPGDCKDLAPWSQLYELCVKTFSIKFPGAVWLGGDGVDHHQSLLLTRAAGAQPMFAEYGDSSSLSSDSDEDDTTRGSAVGDNYNFEDDHQENDDHDAGDVFRMWKRSEGMPILLEDAPRARRQHSLSINSALVSLADMLIANEYNRKQNRQKDFRQQLLGLGR